MFLALHGFEVEAGTRRGCARSARAISPPGTASRSRRWRVDLEREASPLADSAWDLIVCFRFLHRLLLPAIARAVTPGGHLVYETFRVGQQRFGHPTRPRFLLEPGELARAFASLEIVRYEEPDPAGGPITARLHARRPE